MSRQLGDAARKCCAVSWDAWMEFLQMGGYALHVWGSYLVVPALVLIELVLLSFRKHEILGYLGRRSEDSERF